MAVIRIGTRRSALALRQTGIVVDALRERHPELEFEVVEIITTGDRKQGTPEAAVGDKKDWVLEFEEGLLRDEIDCAVHSGKDVPVDIAPGTAVRSVLPRSIPYDVLIVSAALAAKGVRTFQQLPADSRIGTASLRRRACVLHAAAKLGMQGVSVVPLRGNVTTRIEKLNAGNDYDAIILAGASLERLSEIQVEHTVLPAEISLPAMNQGILAVQLRADDGLMETLLGSIEDRATADAFVAERETIRVLQADCRSAVGVFAQAVQDAIQMTARVYAPDGSRIVEQTMRGTAGNDSRGAAVLGTMLGDAILRHGGKELL